MVSPYKQEQNDLNALSARIGADPTLIQAAGGNTSFKRDGILRIKASGTWLMNAERQDIMVPVALDPLLRALNQGDPGAEKAQDFVIAADNPSGLRPSVETTVHAVIPKSVVVHVHCVETIAIAVRHDAEAIFAERLAGLDWIFVPYVRPGLPLARQIAIRQKPGTDVIIFGNHGLVVAADSVAAAEQLLRNVVRRLALPVRPAAPADGAALEHLAVGSDYRRAAEPVAHGAATDRLSCAVAGGGTLYPDHIVFLGPGSVVAQDGEDAAAVRGRVVAGGLPEPVSILFAGAGVLMHANANAAAQALARCLAEVTARIPAAAPLAYLSAENEAEILNWDAEEYRQALNRKPAQTAG